MQKTASAYFERLALADRAEDVHDALVEGVEAGMPTSGIHLMPLSPAPGGAPRSVLRLRDHDPDELAGVVGRAVEVLQPELPDLFEQPDRRLRVEEAFGWQSWLRSHIYNEHFRQTDSARQVVVGLGDPRGAPRGFMAVCRAETDEVFHDTEERQIVTFRDAAERALSAFDLNDDWSRPVGDILYDLSAGLPVPAVLIDASKRVVWMNQEAEVRFGMIAMSYGSSRMYGATTGALAELLHHVQRELDRPGTSLRRGPAPRWLRAGEELVLRRLARPGVQQRVLACLCAAPPRTRTTPHVADVQRAHSLSAREAEVALLAAQGYTVLNMAHRLNVAESTVRTYLKRIYRKLEVCSRAELTWRVLGQ